MELNGGRRRASREVSPDRARVGFAERQGSTAAATLRARSLVRKVQIVYYLCRNGQLEHPHFMELSQLPNKQLRLKDVIERLTLVRGKGMPSLFSWSCKRSYKNGYVWNDLSENDVIYPADGAEYVLKGSEIISGCSASLPLDRFQQLQLTMKRRPKRLHNLEFEEDQEEEEEDEENVEEVAELEDEDAELSCGNSTAGKNTARCSRGVSTDEIEHVGKKPAIKPRIHQSSQAVIPVDDGSPPSSSSSDPVVEPGGSGRSSVLLQLIACGSGVAAAGGKGRKSGGLQRAAACRAAAAAAVEEEVRYISENPRFGNLQGEEKEYFSGSIVEAIRAPAEPRLKKSSSYNEERSSKLGVGEGERLEVSEEGGGLKGKCIPGRNWTSCNRQQHCKK